MGLDIIVHHKNKKKIVEINESLHKNIVSIYNNYKNDNNLLYIEKILDYYKTDVFFDIEDIKFFIDDLSFVYSKTEDSGLHIIMEHLKNKDVIKIHIGGD